MNYDRDQWIEELRQELPDRYEVREGDLMTMYFGPPIEVEDPEADTDWPTIVRVTPFTMEPEGFEAVGTEIVEVNPYWGQVSGSSAEQMDLWSSVQKFVRKKTEGTDVSITESHDSYF